MSSQSQAKRLKEAGFPQGETREYFKNTKPTILGDKDFHIRKIQYDREDFCLGNGDISAPNDKEMLEWLTKEADCRITIYNKGVCWYIDIGNLSVSSDDITEALVQACIKVLEGDGGRVNEL